MSLFRHVVSLVWVFAAPLSAEGEEPRSDLDCLPDVPVADQGGTGGFAGLHSSEVAEEGAEHAVTVRFRQAGMIDLVALVPARRYGVGGLDPQFGMPDEVRIDLVDEEGRVLSEVATFRNLWTDPVRAGHPLIHGISPPVRAAGRKITAGRLRLDSDISDSFVHAWAEAFAFEGERNLAFGAGVKKSSGGSAPSAPWQWAEGFLVDGQTPLGLPEVPGEEDHPNVGWMSDGKAGADDPVWIELDLGSEREFDAVRLFPAKRPTSDLPSGFGFPRRFRISVPGSGNAAASGKEVEMGNPGHSPVLVPLGTRWRGRSVRIDVTRLWKAYESFPAYVAFSEVEVLDDGVNVARGAAVRTSGGMGAVVGSGIHYWIATSLTDGFGPEGRLVSQREWLLALDRRLALEREVHRAGVEEKRKEAVWRRVVMAGVVIFGGAGTVLMVVLPVRYRNKQRAELARVRDRIAGDLHDEVGSNLGSIQMFADLAERHSGPSKELKRIQRIAAETVSAVRDIVWLLRPQGDHRIGTVEHLRETSSIMLEPLDWRFTANEEAWQCSLSDETNRHLFLYFREALHNILRHSGAGSVDIRVDCDDGVFRLAVADNGSGIPVEKMERPSTLRALRQRVEALGASFAVESNPGDGTRLELSIPIARGLRK